MEKATLAMTFHFITGFKRRPHIWGKLRLVAMSDSGGKHSIVAQTLNQGWVFNETYNVVWPLGSAMRVQLQSVGLVKSVRIVAETCIQPSQAWRQWSFTSMAPVAALCGDHQPWDAGP